MTKTTALQLEFVELDTTAGLHIWSAWFGGKKVGEIYERPDVPFSGKPFYFGYVWAFGAGNVVMTKDRREGYKRISYRSLEAAKAAFSILFDGDCGWALGWQGLFERGGIIKTSKQLDKRNLTVWFRSCPIGEICEVSDGRGPKGAEVPILERFFCVKLTLAGERQVVIDPLCELEFTKFYATAELALAAFSQMFARNTAWANDWRGFIPVAASGEIT